MRKTLVLSLFAALAFTATISAQMPPPPGPDAPGEIPMGEGTQPPPGGACGRGGHEGMMPARPNGPAGPGGPEMRRQGPPPELVLKDALGLTDDQVATLRSLLAARGRKPADAPASQLRDAERALADALDSPSPDPNQLGALLLKVKAARMQADPGEAFRAAFTKILTPTQKQKLDQLIALRKSLRAAEELQRLGL